MDRRRRGAVYTPVFLADWLAAELLDSLPKKKDLLILDPACGDGALLRSIAKARRSKIRLAGIDIDPRAVRKATRVLPDGAILRQADALQPDPQGSVESGWERLVNVASISGVISNPPWGARLRQTPPQLRAAGYRLAQGQFDSYEVFLELCIRLVPDGTVLGFIVPDSLFLPEHKPLRALLLERTQIRMIARLGEGLFDDVYRGTAVLLCEKTTPRPSLPIECFRLGKHLRDQVLKNTLTFKAAKEKARHSIPQRHFQSDPEKQFVIDVSRNDFVVFQKIQAHRGNWTESLDSGRGVELSKSGAIISCPACMTARPRPIAVTSLECMACGARFTSSAANSRLIVRKSATAPRGWKKLIVGEDVDRYVCPASRIIQANVPGINYKSPESFRGAKLLIRKTGVGLKAAIDDTGALTNQVVFHYRTKPGQVPAFFLDYVLGVLCSRVMLAYHLKRTGDNEWRSHPYVTQKTISELPVPVPTEGHWQWRQAKAIAEAVSKRRLMKSVDARADLNIDSLVAGLYDLNQSDCNWSLRVLNEAQSLEAIETMRAEATQLRPIKV
jgi:SAM-dependent methyltransferase